MFTQPKQPQHEAQRKAQLRAVVFFHNCIEAQLVNMATFRRLPCQWRASFTCSSGIANTILMYMLRMYCTDVRVQHYQLRVLLAPLGRGQ